MILSKLRSMQLLAFCLPTMLLAAPRGYLINLHGMDAGNKSSVKLFCEQNNFKYLSCEDGAGEPNDNLPRIYFGFSVGGNFTYRHTAAKASKVLCATPCGSKTEDYNSGWSSVPIMQVNGQGDFGTYARDKVAASVKQGARSAFARCWSGEHGVFYAYDMFVPFWAECIRLRLPPGATRMLDAPKLADGWLCDMSTWETSSPYIARNSEYKGNRDTMAWVPSRYVAYLWRAFSVGKGTQRTSPFIISQPAAPSISTPGEFPQIAWGKHLRD